jgi:DNA-binding response OmpR family regulator
MVLKTLLAVEDDPDVALLLRMCLDEAHYQIDVAGDLAGARARLARQRPDLVIVDVGLPDGDGLDLCREVKAAHPRLPVLILTALSRRHRGLEAQARAGGADGFMEKPFDPDLLAAEVAHLLTPAP